MDVTERLTDYPKENFILRIVGAKEGDPLQYNLPTTDDRAMLVVGDCSLDTFKRDIVIETRNKELKRISELHPAYMALQYPLLFLYGERGFHVGVFYSSVTQRNKNEKTITNISMQDYYYYQFHYRPDQPNPFLAYGLLCSQAKVNTRACIAGSRLSYILNIQGSLGIEHFQGIIDAINRGCNSGCEIGKAIILPASHIGGRCYMIQNYHDNIAICRVFGPPDFFFTFTCNPKWLEIVNNFYNAEQKPSDKSDVIVRVYHMKFEELIQDIKLRKMFDPCTASMFFIYFYYQSLLEHRYTHVLCSLLAMQNIYLPFLNKVLRLNLTGIDNSFAVQKYTEIEKMTKNDTNKWNTLFRNY
jgi:hypothetical protein